MGITIPGVWLPLLLLILVPALSNVRRHADHIKQMGQFHSIAVALQLFNSEFNGYPPSDALDTTGYPYCGAMKLAEAMVGQDLRGFNTSSRFERNGFDWTVPSDGMSYPPMNYPNATKYAENIKSREKYLPFETANAYRLKDVYENVGPFDGNSFVICDVYTKKRHSGKKTGMPILYYRANISSKTMDAGEPMNKRIYNAEDNLALVQLARTRSGGTHPLADNGGKFFYDKGYIIIDPSITNRDWPHNADSYVLISAGRDGLYGTSDDVVNFAR